MAYSLILQNFKIMFNFTVALYAENKGDMLCMFQGQQGGITHIMFSPDGNQLYSGGRKVLVYNVKLNSGYFNKFRVIILKLKTLKQLSELTIPLHACMTTMICYPCLFHTLDNFVQGLG